MNFRCYKTLKEEQRRGDQQGYTSKDTVVASFKLLSWHSPKRFRKAMSTLYRWPVLQTRYESSTTGIQVQSITYEGTSKSFRTLFFKKSLFMLQTW